MAKKILCLILCTVLMTAVLAQDKVDKAVQSELLHDVVDRLIQDANNKKGAARQARGFDNEGPMRAMNKREFEETIYDP
ncbi:Hypothetical predicted protein [Cloeon dipterum]|uniref:Uncharacterized protein n=1 Tax=Cloeon dipterum TaxID=197152 RepID=A0A8S1E0A5_9INSE|nr:Hypothetical predicted protein [Cloeon dipterum]